MPKLVCLSDTHNQHKKIKLPDGDILVHCGDFTGGGTISECASFLKWFGEQPHPYKVFCAGNHDWLFEDNPTLARSMVPSNVIYLEDSMAEICGLKFYGSPQTPFFCNWAFNRERGEEIKRYWDKIPENLDVLITHGPVHGILDYVPSSRENVGCKDMFVAIQEKKPRYYLCGHIHESHGYYKGLHTEFYNVACLDDRYKVAYPATVIQINSSSVLPE